MESGNRLEDASPSATDNIMEIRDASVSFDMDRGESRVLDNASMDIKREEIIGIVGESGSGKSMFASALLDAVVEPGVLTGEITYYPTPDEPVDLLALSDKELKQTRWEEISMVFQGAMSSFNPTMKIRGHFEETLRAHNHNLEEGIKRAYELLSDLYMTPERVLDSYPHELSGGMKQRALIALSLVLEPQVLVMDEPTAALDLLMQRSILRLLKEIKEKYEITLVFITHDLPLVADLSDRLAVLYAFQFVECGPTDEILQHAAHPYTRQLLNSTPNLDAPLDEMKSISGSSPDPVHVPSGCSYHPRCSLSDEECEANDPEYHLVTEGTEDSQRFTDATGWDDNLSHEDHGVKCFHWEQAAEAVPFVSTEREVNQ